MREGTTCRGSGRIIYDYRQIRVEAQPREVYFRRRSWEVLRLPLDRTGNRGEPREVRGDHGNEEPSVGEGGAAAHRSAGGVVAIHVRRGREGSPLFPMSQTEQQVRLDQGMRGGLRQAEGISSEPTSFVQATGGHPSVCTLL